MKEKKLLIISRSFPPFVVGSPVLLSNLFESYTGPLSAIASWQYEAKVDVNFQAPCKTHYLKMPSNFLQRVHDRFAHKLIWLSKMYIRAKIKREKPDCVFLVYPSPEFLVAGYQVCRDMKIPYMVHMHDLWEENYPVTHPKGILAGKWEKHIIRDAYKVFGMTDIQQEHYIKKYNVEVLILPHTIRPERIIPQPARVAKQKDEKRTVIYSGNVSNAMNLDALQQFVKAVEFLPANYEVKMFISASENEAKKMDIFSSRILYDWVPMERVQKEIHEADVLFLPLSFKNAAMEEVRTVFATKTLDYLVSGTPILVFSPAMSFHTISAKKSGWGLVVEKDDPETLAKSICELTENMDLASGIVQNAVKEAHDRNAARYAKNLEELVSEVSAHQG